jgi:RND family efflux transporter MFP subunit
VSGYLAKITVDKGDHVKEGQFIAEINSPELDHQYRSAQADLENKRRLARRARDLANQNFFSEQAAEDAETNVRLSEQQVAELRAITSYKVLHAPFSGVVTARYADLGALVTNATSNLTSALPPITDVSRLRVTVYVDQSEAPNVPAGTPAEVVDSANPARTGLGKVARAAGELDARTRTLLTEVDFDNSKGEFIPGSFGNVSLLIPAKSYVEVPAGALVMREGKRMVAVVGSDSRVKLTPINVAGTDGKVIRIERAGRECARCARPAEYRFGWIKVTAAVPPGQRLRRSRPGAGVAASPGHGCGAPTPLRRQPRHVERRGTLEHGRFDPPGWTRYNPPMSDPTAPRSDPRRRSVSSPAQQLTPRAAITTWAAPRPVPCSPRSTHTCCGRKRVDALLVLLSRKDRRLMTVDELRRNIESLGAEAYDKMTYYERWIHSISQTLIQRGVLSIDELGRKIADVEARHRKGEL